ncbi:MAG: VWA domain-containing protein [Terracidiphilus sp.]|jgi:VWFA-related protein
MKRSRQGWVGAFYLCSALFVSAQQAPPPTSQPDQSPLPAAGSSPTLTPRSHEERERNYESAHRIILNVEVTDASGKEVNGLKGEDFTLLDNQLPRKLLSFHEKNGIEPGARAHAFLVLDALNNNVRTMGFERKGIENFLGRNQGHLVYPITVGVLSHAGISVSQPSQNGNALIAELERMSSGLRPSSCAEEAGDGGLGKPLVGGAMVGLKGQVEEQSESGFSKMANCENARFKLSISELDRLARNEVENPGRAILIWIGPGWPQLTGSQYIPDTPATRRGRFDYRVSLSTALREAQITLDAVSFPDRLRDAEPHGDADKALISGVATEEQATVGSMALPVLVHETGGKSLEDSKDIAASIATCLADAASYYVLSFNSSEASKVGEYHALELRVNRPVLTARTNRAYYTQP